MESTLLCVATDQGAQALSLRVCACARLCVTGGRVPEVAASCCWQALLHTSPAPSPRPLLGSYPVCKHFLFLSVISFGCPPAEKGYNSGRIACHPLPGPRTPLPGPCCGRRGVVPGEGVWWKDPQGPFPSKFSPETWGQAVSQAISVGFLE